jgi:transcriptional regulator with XRE-family HTH domain
MKKSKAIGKRIRARRIELGLTQRSIGEPGSSYAYISRVESGERSPSIEALIAIAEKLETTALALLSGDPDAPCPVCGRNHVDGEIGRRSPARKARIARRWYAHPLRACWLARRVSLGGQGADGRPGLAADVRAFAGRLRRPDVRLRLPVSRLSTKTFCGTTAGVVFRVKRAKSTNT